MLQLGWMIVSILNKPDEGEQAVVADGSVRQRSLPHAVTWLRLRASLPPHTTAATTTNFLVSVIYMSYRLPLVS